MEERSTSGGEISLTFSVYADTKLGETVCIVGNVPELGCWRHNRARPLKLVTHGEFDAKWTQSIRVPDDQVIEYRYFIGLVQESAEGGGERDVIVLRWESNITPHSFNPMENGNGNMKERVLPEEIFGMFDGISKVDRGWLTCQTEIRIRLHSKPVKWFKMKYNNFKLRVSLSPVDLHMEELKVVPEDEQEQGCDLFQMCMTSRTLVASLDGVSNQPTEQPAFGVPVNDRSYVVFYTQTIEPETTGYQIKFYAENQGRTPELLGNAYLLPVALKSSVGQNTTPIIGSQFSPIGQVTVDWLIIKPMVNNSCDMRLTFARYWRHSRAPLDVGHRGMGSSHSSKGALCECAAAQENTLASLSKAGTHGADYVEFDVQLSKDRVPVVYHDFTVYLSIRKKERSALDWFQIGVNELDHAQLQLLKIDNAAVGEHDCNAGTNTGNETSSDHQPFPCLKDVFEHVDVNVGFNIEIKYPQVLRSTGELEDGLKYYADRNPYVDRILEEVLLCAQPQRRIIFSCFDPEVCSMLRVKQNRYPVMFLTKGDTNRYPSYSDSRMNCTPTACFFCEMEGFLGVNAHTEDLLKNPGMVALAKERGLVVFCWGEDANDRSTIQQLKDMGVAAVIYDRINELKDVKESVFTLEKNRERELALSAASGVLRDAVAALSVGSLMDNLGFHRVYRPEPHQFQVPTQVQRTEDDYSRSDTN